MADTIGYEVLVASNLDIRGDQARDLLSVSVRKCYHQPSDRFGHSSREKRLLCV